MLTLLSLEQLKGEVEMIAAVVLAQGSRSSPQYKGKKKRCDIMAKIYALIGIMPVRLPASFSMA